MAKESALEARQIHRALEAAVDEDHWIDGHCKVRIVVEPEHVVLQGSCNYLSAKRRMVALAGLLSRGRRVVDRIRLGDVAAKADHELLEAVATRLRVEPVFGGCTILTRAEADEIGPEAGHRIVIAVRDGLIELRGTVGSINHRRFAEVLAWWTPGCALVDNHLVVDPPQSDSDNELNDAVRMVLEGDPFVDPAQLHFGTAAGIVQLEGVVIDTNQRNRVLEDVWTVPGVWDIDDCLQLEAG